MNGKKLKPVENGQLFDASESFSSALYLSRIERGEPAEGLSRRVWESEKWINGNPLKFSGLVFVLGSILGLSAWLLRKNRKLEQTEFKFKDSA